MSDQKIDDEMVLFHKVPQLAREIQLGEIAHG